MKSKILMALGCSALVLLVLVAAAVHQSQEATTDQAGSLRVVPHGEMSLARAAHKATTLTDGRILITGGCSENGCTGMIPTAEIYDPVARTFRAAAAMSEPRGNHSAVALIDGRVLVAGGWSGRHTTASAEIYDPRTDRWTPVADMGETRGSPTATLLQDGRVLLVGGTRDMTPLASAEIFDPATATFSAVAPMSTPRASHASVVLSDGRVLVTGGSPRRRAAPLPSVEIFDPITNEFRPTGPMEIPRYKHAAVLRSDGKVVVIGGSDERDGHGLHRSTEIYDPEAGTFAPGPEMHRGRFKIPDAVVVLPSGALLVAGGDANAELLQPDSGVFTLLEGRMSGVQAFATGNLLPSGEVLVLGGYGNEVRPSAAAWLVRGGR